MRKYENILLDADTLGAGLEDLSAADAAIEFHRFYLSLCARHRFGEVFVCRGPGQSRRASDVVIAARNLGVSVAVASTAFAALSAMALNCAHDGQGALLVSSHVGAPGFLRDTPSALHLMPDPFGAAKVLTLALWYGANQSVPPAMQAREARQVSIERNEPDLMAHRWWLAERGALAVFQPGIWRGIERWAR